MGTQETSMLEKKNMPIVQMRQQGWFRGGSKYDTALPNVGPQSGERKRTGNQNGRVQDKRGEKITAPVDR